MQAFWEILSVGAPYAKIIEYVLIFATLVGSVYAGKILRASASEARQVAGALNSAAERYASERMLAVRAEDQIEDRSDAIVSGEEKQAADAVLSVNGSRSAEREAHALWWQPLVEMKFDDQNRPSPRLYWKNNVRVPMPSTGTWLTAWHNERPNGVCGVALSGKAESVDTFWRKIRRDVRELQSELLEGAAVEAGRFGIGLTRSNAEFRNDDERREWIKTTLIRFVGVLAPRMMRLL